MLQNAYILVKLNADTAENNLNFVFKKLTTILQNSVQPPPRELLALSLAACRGAAGTELTSPGRRVRAQLDPAPMPTRLGSASASPCGGSPRRAPLFSHLRVSWGPCKRAGVHDKLYRIRSPLYRIRFCNQIFI